MPPTSRIFRLFISSTFADMAIERGLLHTRVFPVIDAYCRTRGATFQAIDLRWGVSEQHQREHRTVEVCLAEIARCQRLTPAPNFLVLLGERYGWEPVPARIPALEFGLIRAVAAEADRELLDAWYRRDDNALPPEMRLRGIEEATQAGLEWRTAEPAVRRALRTAVVGTTLSVASQAKYFQSATHQEIAAGVLDALATGGPRDPAEHVLACVRTIHGLAPGDGVYRDPDPTQVAQVRDALQERLLADNLFAYDAMWSASTGQLTLDADRFVDVVVNHLRRTIDRELGADADESPADAELRGEWRRHAALCADAETHVVGRDQDAVALRAALDRATGDRPIVIEAPSGAGKSAVVALMAAREMQQRGVVIVRFVGATAASLRADSLLRGVIAELGDALEVGAPDSDDPEELVEALGKLLASATAQRPITILIDALDQLDHPGRVGDWWPTPLPEYVRVLLSRTSTGGVAGGRYETFLLRAMEQHEAGSMLDVIMVANARTLTTAQRALVLEAYAATPLPLFLRLASAEAIRWSSWTSPVPLPAGIDAMVHRLVSQLTAEHNPSREGRTTHLVESVLDLIGSARYGLSEQELLLALAGDDVFMRDLANSTHHPLEGASIPDALWSRLRHDLSPLLIERHTQGAMLMALDHRRIGEALVRIRETPDGEHVGHRRLARYFAGESVWLDDDATRPAERVIAELPFQLVQSRAFDAWASCVTDPSFVMATADAGLMPVFIEDLLGWDELLPMDVRQSVAAWRQLLEAQGHLMARETGTWSTSRVLAQVTLEQPADHPVHQAVRVWWRQHRPGVAVLRSPIPPAKASRGSVRVLEGHTATPDSVVLLPDGRLASCASNGDTTVRLSDTHGRRSDVLDHEDTAVCGICLWGTTTLIAWCDDGSIHGWDTVTAARLWSFQEHSDVVAGVHMREDGTCLSWSADGSIHCWTPGEDITHWVIEAHADGVQHVMLLSRDRILSLGEDGQRVWRDDGTLLSWRPRYRWAKVMPSGLLVSEVVHTDGEPAVVIEDEATLAMIALLDESLVADRWYDELFAIFQQLAIAVSGYSLHIEDDEDEVESEDVRWIALDDQHLIAWRAGRMWSPYCWSAVTGECVAIWPDRGLRVSGMLAIPGRGAVVWGNRGELVTWSPFAAEPLGRFDRHTSSVSCARLLSDGQLITGHEDGTLHRWNVSSGQCTARMSGHGGEVHGVKELPDGRLASWAADEAIRIWKPATFPVEPESEGQASSGRLHRTRSSKADGYAVAPSAIHKVVAFGTDRFALFSGYSQVLVVDGQRGTGLETLDHKGLRLQGLRALSGGALVSWGSGDIGHITTVWDANSAMVQRITASLNPYDSFHGSQASMPPTQFAGDWLFVNHATMRTAAWHWPSNELIPFTEFVRTHGGQTLDGRPVALTLPSRNGLRRALYEDGSEGPLLRSLSDGSLLGWRGSTLSLWRPDGSVAWHQRQRGGVADAHPGPDGALLTWRTPGTGKSAPSPAQILDLHTGAVRALLPVLGASPVHVAWFSDNVVFSVIGTSDADASSIPLRDDTIIAATLDNEELGRSIPFALMENIPDLWTKWAAVRGVAAGGFAAVAHGPVVYAAMDGKPLQWHGDGTWALDAAHASGLLALHRENVPLFLELGLP